MGITSILVANRGEIARRVIRTARRLGVRTIAVHSEVDEDALFVREADERKSLGGKKPGESYLNIEKIIDIAKSAKCDAIHPGYGFLSENPEFVRSCEEAGITFIGPGAEQIRVMADKAEARKTAAGLSVPVIPGSDVLECVEDAVEASRKLAFPVLLKAAAGGGGIGMVKVESDDEFVNAFESASNRAGFAFGDNRVYLEKYLEEPHHIEIQVLRDTKGNVVTFWERECSVQRRYQKIVEESPSTYVTEELRKSLREAAKKLVSGIGYINAGTIEFVVDKERNFYFLEANTRLQVEHPITEEIAGVDLVELQIRIASGEELPTGEDDIQFKGHAIESRIYAEDPEKFLPSPGTVTGYEEPAGEGVRVDSGIEAKGVVSPFYDPLIAKLITFGDTRDIAIERMLRALRNYRIEGIKSNIPFLLDAIDSSLFRNGGYDTHFIEKFRG